MRTVVFFAGLWLLAINLFAEDEKKMIAYWSFDEGKGDVVADLSGSKMDGKIQNNMQAVEWVEGRKGMALRFAGSKEPGKNGCVYVKNFKTDLSKSMTMELWVKMDANCDWQSGLFVIVSNNRDTYGPGMQLYYNWRNFMFCTNDKNAKESYIKLTAPVADLRDQWVHLAVTSDGKEIRLYLNGELISTKPGKLFSNDNLFIGSAYLGRNYGFQGVIDEMKIYNYTMTPDEIVTIAKLN